MYSFTNLNDLIHALANIEGLLNDLFEKGNWSDSQGYIHCKIKFRKAFLLAATVG